MASVRRRLPASTSYVLEKNGHRMLLACDSANTDLFAAVARQSSRDRGILDRRVRPVDRQSCESGTGLVDVPADGSALPGSDSLGHVQTFKGADGRAATTVDRGGGRSAGADRSTQNRWNVDPARIRRVSPNRGRTLTTNHFCSPMPSRLLAIRPARILLYTDPASAELFCGDRSRASAQKTIEDQVVRLRP